MTEAIKRLQQKLGTAPEAVLVTDELNLYYFTGFHYTDGFLLITPEEAVIYTDSRYTEAARKQNITDGSGLPLQFTAEQLGETLSWNETMEAGAKIWPLVEAAFWSAEQTEEQTGPQEEAEKN